MDAKLQRIKELIIEKERVDGELESLLGAFGPRGMPLDLREKIAADFRAVLAADPVIAERIAATGQVVQVSGPAELAAGIAEQRAKLAAIAKALGIKTAQ